MKDCAFDIEKDLQEKLGFVMTKRTLGGTCRKRKRTSGFRVRMRTKNGQRVIKARRRKGRERLSV